MRIAIFSCWIFFFGLCLLIDLPAWAGGITNSHQQIRACGVRIPARKRAAMSGSKFLCHIAGMDEHHREAAIRDALLQGDLPNFLRRFKPVTLSHVFDDGRRVEATILVMPDYLAVGSDDDFVRMPMNFRTAGEVAARMGCLLPTRKMVDAIFRQSDYHFKPQPMAPGPRMRSTAYYRIHNEKIRSQRLAAGIALGELVSGDKKDVVISNRLLFKEGRIAIYGWYRPTGVPIQPLSTVHGAGYADYSHGVRLVSDTVLIDGLSRSLNDALADPHLAPLFSDEGAIHDARRLMKQAYIHYKQNSPLYGCSISLQQRKPRW
jgi:hypothetical protein